MTPKVGLPLEAQEATIVASTPVGDGWVILCLRWRDVSSYVVWDAFVRDGRIECRNGGYYFAEDFGDSINEYSRRGGQVKVTVYK